MTNAKKSLYLGVVQIQLIFNFCFKGFCIVIIIIFFRMESYINFYGKKKLFIFGGKCNYLQFLYNLNPQGSSNSPKVAVLICSKIVFGLKSFNF